MVSRRPLIGIAGRPIAAGRIGSSAAVGVGVLYLEALARAGAAPVVLVPRPIDASAARDELAGLDGLLLLGGPDVDPSVYEGAPHPTITGTDASDDRFEMELTRAALTGAVPLLAICRGIQVLNVALDGTLVANLPDVAGTGPHGRPGRPGGAHEHAVTLTDGSLLATTMGATTVVCSCHHHQALDRLGRGVTVTARAADGVVEGVEVEGAWALAVQWHPEDTAVGDPAQQALFDALAARATSRV